MPLADRLVLGLIISCSFIPHFSTLHCNRHGTPLQLTCQPTRHIQYCLNKCRYSPGSAGLAPSKSATQLAGVHAQQFASLPATGVRQKTTTWGLNFYCINTIPPIVPLLARSRTLGPGPYAMLIRPREPSGPCRRLLRTGFRFNRPLCGACNNVNLCWGHAINGCPEPSA